MKKIPTIFKRNQENRGEVNQTSEERMMQELREVRALILGEVSNLRDNMMDNISADKVNKSAGARARKNTLNLEKLFKQYRKLSV